MLETIEIKKQTIHFRTVTDNLSKTYSNVINELK